MSEINNTVNPDITTYHVDIKKLQAGEKLTMQSLMKDFAKLIDLFSKALNTKNLDTIHVVHKENETPIKTFISQNVNKKEGPINIQNLNTAISRTLKDTDTLPKLIALAVDNNSKEIKGEKRPEYLNKIKIHLQPSKNTSTNNAVGQPTVTAQGVNGQNVVISKKGNPAKVTENENGTKYRIKGDFVEYVLMHELENGKYGKLV